jgi:hypothetical protein
VHEQSRRKRFAIEKSLFTFQSAFIEARTFPKPAPSILHRTMPAEPYSIGLGVLLPDFPRHLPAQSIS